MEQEKIIVRNTFPYPYRVLTPQEKGWQPIASCQIHEKYLDDMRQASNKERDRLHGYGQDAPRILRFYCEECRKCIIIPRILDNFYIWDKELS